MNLLKYFCRKRELSPDHIGKYSLDKHGYVDLSNQRIDCSYLANKYIRCNFYKSLFAHSDTIYRIEGKAFIDSLFCGTIFKAAAEHGNKFYNCIFDSVNFKEAIIGYGSSCYTNCTFTTWISKLRVLNIVLLSAKWKMFGLEEDSPPIL